MSSPIFREYNENTALLLGRLFGWQVDLLPISDELYSINFLNSDPSLKKPAYTELNLHALKADCALQRARISLRLADSGPPPQFRLIDCASTCARNAVVLVDYSPLSHPSYTAISHTWGEAVYVVFDCECVSDCSACCIPRYDSSKPCTGHANPQERTEVVDSVLSMCKHAMAAGSQFVWHDGVCIAQHNKQEVDDAIRHMGWVYANASDTIIFFHNIGKPMAVLPLEYPYKTRWNQRVWTLQEAMLSKRRRYCIGLPRFDDEPFKQPSDALFNSCFESVAEYWKAKHMFCTSVSGTSKKAMTTLKEFEEQLEKCYEDDSCIAVIEEEELWSHLLSLLPRVVYILKYTLTFAHGSWRKAQNWFAGMDSWLHLMARIFFQFPKLPFLIAVCAGERQSKHEGDRINSVLGLAGITDFVAPKDGNFEDSTIQFLKRFKGRPGQEQPELLCEVLLWVNTFWDEEDRKCKKHTWLPSLAREVRPLFNLAGSGHFRTQYEILEDGMLQLTGSMLCVAVKFTSVSDTPQMSAPRFCKSRQEYEQVYTGCKNINLLEIDLLDQDRTELHLVGFCALARGSNTQLGRLMTSWREFTDAVIGPIRRPMIGGQLMEVGGSFLGHLLFARDHEDKAVIVQGEYWKGRPVSKLGVLELSPHFLDFLLLKQPFCIDKISEIIIS